MVSLHPPYENSQISNAFYSVNVIAWQEVKRYPRLHWPIEPGMLCLPGMAG